VIEKLELKFIGIVVCGFFAMKLIEVLIIKIKERKKKE
jgi:hypothetical protein